MTPIILGFCKELILKKTGLLEENSSYKRYHPLTELQFCFNIENSGSLGS